MKAKSILRVFLGLAVFLSATGISSGQSTDLSLSDAIQKTLNKHYGIIIQKADVEISGISNNWGTAGRYPNIGFTAGTNNSLPIASDGSSYLNRISGNLNLNWTIFDDFRVNLTKEKLEYLEDFSKGRLAVVIENSIEDLILQYYFVLLQKERLDVLNRLKELSDDRYEYVKIQKDLGSAVSYEVLQARNIALNDKTDVMNQEVVVRNAMRNLNFLMGEESSVQWNLTEEFEHSPGEYVVGDLLDKILTNNNTLRNQFIQLKLEQNQTEMNRGDFMPSVSLSAGAGDQYQLGVLFGENGSTRANTNPAFTPFANLSLSYNIYSGGNRKRAMEIAKINEEIAAVETEQMKQSITNLLLNEYDAYSVRKEMLLVAEESIEAAELNLSIASDKLKAGVINSFNYRDIQIMYLNSALNRLNAIYSLISSNTALTRLTGGFVNE